MIRSVALALAVVLLAGTVHAQPTDVAKADALFKEGRALMKSGNYETACPKLEESYRLDPAAGTGINLGDCFEKQGKVASALLAYQAARALLRPGDPRIGPVEKEVAALDKRAPRLTIKLTPGAPDGTTVKRDGREVEASKLGVPVAVNPGKLKVVVSAPGRESAVFRVSLVEGKGRELEVGPGESRSGPEQPAAPPAVPKSRGGEASGDPATDSPWRTVGWGVAGVGVIILGLGVASALDANAISQETDGKTGRDWEEGNEDFKMAKSRTVWLFAAGSAVAGGGVALVLLSPARPNSSTTLRAAPQLAGGGYGLRIEGAWQ